MASLPRADNQSFVDSLPQMFQNLWSGDCNGARTDLPRNSIALDTATVTTSVPESLIGFTSLQEQVPQLIPVGAREFMQNNGARGTISLDLGTVTSSVPESLIGFTGLQEQVPPLIPVGARGFIENNGASGNNLLRNSISLDPGTVTSSVPGSLMGFTGLQEPVPPLTPLGAHELLQSIQIQNTLTGVMSSPISDGGISVNHAPRLNHLYQGQSFTGNYNGDYLTGNSLNSSLGYDLGNLVNRPLVGYPFGERIGSRLPIIPNLLTSMDSCLGRDNFSPLNPVRFPINNGPFIGHNNPWVEFQSGEATIRNSCSESNAPTENDSVIQDLYCNLMLLGTGWSNAKILRLLSGDQSLLNELQGQDIILMAKYQTGSQYLQKFLVMEDPASVQKIFDGTIRSILNLMSDQFGNCLFQKLLRCCNLDQIKRIVFEVTRRQGLIDVAKDEYGARSVQKLLTTLKFLNLPLIEHVMLTLAPGMDLLMKNKTGSLLIQNCLRHLDHKQNEFIYNAAIKNWLKLASDEQGCISLNSVIETIQNPHREELFRTITLNSLFLSQDPFGNFVVQKVIELRSPDWTSAICHQLSGNYERLSLQKYGSHVVEKCLASTGMAVVVMDLLLAGDRLAQLALDSYGNYVIQTALKTTKKMSYNLYKQLVITIIPHLHKLQNHPTAGNVFNLINKELPNIPV